MLKNNLAFLLNSKSVLVVQFLLRLKSTVHSLSLSLSLSHSLSFSLPYISRPKLIEVLFVHGPGLTHSSSRNSHSRMSKLIIRKKNRSFVSKPFSFSKCCQYFHSSIMGGGLLVSVLTLDLNSASLNLTGIM